MNNCFIIRLRGSRWSNSTVLNAISGIFKCFGLELRISQNSPPAIELNCSPSRRCRFWAHNLTISFCFLDWNYWSAPKCQSASQKDVLSWDSKKTVIWTWFWSWFPAQMLIFNSKSIETLKDHFAPVKNHWILDFKALVLAVLQSLSLFEKLRISS